MRNGILFLAAAFFAAAHSAQAATPSIIAHRGASHDAPENTLASIRLGYEQGADFVEVDLYLSADNEVVLIHDADTRRTAGVEKKVNAQTLAELKQLDVGSFKDPKWAGERIPTLAEALAAIPSGKGMFLELKAGKEIIPKLAEGVERSGLKPSQLVIIGFKLETVIAAKERLPKNPAYWIVSFKKSEPGNAWTPTAAEVIEKARGKLDGLDLRACDAVDAALVKRASAARLPVYVWTVNDVELARQMQSAGVLGITTDRPKWLREGLRLP